MLPRGFIFPPRPPAGDIILSRGCDYGDAIAPPAEGPVETPRPEGPPEPEPFEGESGYKCFEYGFDLSIDAESSPLLAPEAPLLAPKYLFLRSCTPSILSLFIC